ncbi:MAG: LysR family transcriptional regulator [Saccharospirillum sp.]
MNLEALNVKKLLYFSDLAATGSFSKSAKRLGIAQPALSISMRKLEEEVGLKLINRAERRMTLTSDGAVLLKYARLIMAQLEEANRELSELKGLESGVVHLGASAMLSSYLLAPKLIAFKQQYPGIRLRLTEAGTDTLEQMVINGELDLALVRHEPDHEQIRHAEKLEEQIVALLPTHHHLAQKVAISVEDFSAQPLVLFRKGYFLRESIEARARQTKRTLDIRFETNLIELMKKLVLAEVGLSTCLDMIIDNDSRLCTRPFDPPIPLNLAWGWRKNHYLSQASQAFLTFWRSN